MKIHYLSCHEILEYDEVRLLTDLGHDVFSNGAYLDPEGHITLKRPGIPKLIAWPKLAEIAANTPKTALTAELIDPFDVLIVMHTPEQIISNWDRIKHKRVIWRTIGQSTQSIEKKLERMRSEGLQIVRYSPKERNIPGYIGEDALIRFYKDPGEFCGWVGDSDEVVNFTQSLKGRGQHVHYEEIMGSIAGFNSKVYGTDNDNLGAWNGGLVSFTKMLEVLKHARVFVYGGTWPASYTLSIIEAMMLGIPVVTIDRTLAQNVSYNDFEYFEADEIVEHGVSGFVGHSVQEMRGYIERLVNDYSLAQEISKTGRKRAIELFGRDQISDQWRKFLEEGAHASQNQG